MVEKDRSALWNTSKINPQDWQANTEILTSAREIGSEIEEGFKLMETAKPTERETSETGTFMEFAGGFPRIKPVYQTSSGKKFTP